MLKKGQKKTPPFPNDGAQNHCMMNVFTLRFLNDLGLLQLIGYKHRTFS